MATKRLSGMTTSASVPDNGGDHSGGGGSGGTFVEDVFSTYLYTGTGAELDVVNGIDLDGEGGMVWQKYRKQSYGHLLFDTERGIRGSDSAGWMLSSNNTNKETASDGVRSFNSDGFTTQMNTVDEMVSWTFRKQPNFFDVVTYTGNGVAGREIPHNLGCDVGFAVVKKVNETGHWYAQHRDLDLSNDKTLMLSTPSKNESSVNGWNSTHATSEHLIVGDHGDVNGINSEYVAYLFAHDDSEDGMIQCGSYTGNGSETNGTEVNLGFEPQWLLVKAATTTADWFIIDSMRGWGPPDTGTSSPLKPNLSSAESSNLSNTIELSSTGFKAHSTSDDWNGSGQEYLFIAIRRPNKQEEFEPEELFAPVKTKTGPKPNAIAGFPVDMAWIKNPTRSDEGNYLASRLTQGEYLETNSTAESLPGSIYTFDFQDGWFHFGSDAYYSWMWRRAPGYFDVVVYEGTGVAGLQIPHNLGVKPEMMWVKSLGPGTGEWAVYSDYVTHATSTSLDGKLHTNTLFGHSFFNEPTDEVFEIKNGPDNHINAGRTIFYIAYLFASVPGICDLGTYTGNGGDQEIDCGFTNGARWVLIKSTDRDGDWMHFDTLRGISDSDSPMLKLNEADAQVSGSYIKPHPKGFTVTANLTGIPGAEYIYYAIA